jgi:hypothetical protein
VCTGVPPRACAGDGSAVIEDAATMVSDSDEEERAFMAALPIAVPPSSSSLLSHGWARSAGGPSRPDEDEDVLDGRPFSFWLKGPKEKQEWLAQERNVRRSSAELLLHHRLTDRVLRTFVGRSRRSRACGGRTWPRRALTATVGSSCARHDL